ncbi:MAG TPA: folate-binding protein [Candidatus Sulfotelmatobacter sp.]
MKQTPLLNALQSETAAPAHGEYRGVESIASFGNADREFAALRSGCGIYDLGFRAKISLTGNDRVRWLNGMVSNNIKELTPGRGVYAFILNPQGKILGDLYAYNRGESLLLDTDQSQLEKILAIFKRYIIMDRVELIDVSDELTAIGIAGPLSREVLGKAGVHAPELSPLEFVTPRCDCSCDCLECPLVRSDDTSVESYEIWVAPESLKQTWDALLSAGATPVGFEAFEKNRIVSGIPRYGVDIRERELPQETGQMRALHFQKGCYIGQEIVERIRSRGNVHRNFTGFVSEGTGDIAPGAVVTLAGKEIGEITSVASLRDSDGERTVALGYIRRETGSPGREVMIGTNNAVVAQIPLTAAHPRIEPAAVSQ